MSLSKYVFAAALVASSAFAANAATVASVGTTGTGPFTVDAGNLIVVSNPAWDLNPTSPYSEWIWSDLDNFSHTFTYQFNLAGYSTSSASLNGLIGLDDTGEIYLNGNLIFSALTGNHYSNLVSYGTSDDAYFNAGLNTLTITDNNTGGGPAATRATATIDATPVPLPGTLPLLGGALALVGFGASRKRRNTSV